MANWSKTTKNATFMQVRMLVAMAVGLVTSRITLQQLGVEDYGAYSLVWGVLTLIVFANTTVCNASIRFLSYDLVEKEIGTLKNTFAACRRAHLYVAIAVAIIAETIGLLYIWLWANLPEGRLPGVIAVFQISMITVVATILQSPYSSLLIAKERMDSYSAIEIVNVLLKLGLVCLLIVCSFDKLILLSSFYAILSVVIYFTYRLYCRNQFVEVTDASLMDKTKCHQILKFSATDLYGNACVSARDNGFVIIINAFFGVVYNTACNLATVVNRAFSGLASNVLYAFKPQITISYAANDFRQMSKLIGRSSFGSVSIMGVAVVIAISFMPFLLKLWLGEVPENAIVFTNLLLITGLVETIYNPLVTAIHSSGKIKALSFLNGTLYLINLPLIALIYAIGLPAYSAYFCLIAIDVVIWISTMIIFKKVLPDVAISNYLSAISFALLLSAVVAVIIYSFVLA